MNVIRNKDRKVSADIRDFCERWTRILWDVMQASGKGYMRHSMRNTGIGNDRRKDKLENPKQSKFARSYAQRYATVSSL